jgi:type II secretion system protein I
MNPKKTGQNCFLPRWPKARNTDAEIVLTPFYGFSLLEVILSLAILAGSLAALGEVMRQGDRNASLSSDETQAQIVASSIMDELIAGYRPLTATDQDIYDPTIEPPWLYSIAIENTQYAELVAVRVLVERQMEPQQQPPKFELVRWLMNPNVTASQTDSQSGASSSSGGTSSSSGSSGGSSSAAGGTGGGP